jgi:rare lipoprotein A
LLASAVLAGPAPATAGDATSFDAKIVHASWYGEAFARRPTASGQLFDPNKLTGAHRTLPMGTRLRVTNLHNGRTVMVTINDRGPYVRPRELDLSYGAARVLGMIRRGVARVRIEPIES